MSGIILVGTIGSAVVVVAMVENKLERIGKHVEPELVNTIMKTVLALGGLGGAFWVLWEAIKKFILFI